MPILLSLPPTSLKPYSDFYNTAFAFRRRASCGSVVQIGLRKMNNGKDDYSVATFRRLYDFEGEQLRQIRAHAAGFREQLKGLPTMKEEDAPTAEVPVTQPEDGYANEAPVTVPDEEPEDLPFLPPATASAAPDEEPEDLPFWPSSASSAESFSVSSADAGYIDGERMDLPA